MRKKVRTQHVTTSNLIQVPRSFHASGLLAIVIDSNMDSRQKEENERRVLPSRDFFTVYILDKIEENERRVLPSRDLFTVNFCSQESEVIYLLGTAISTHTPFS
jgi:hypothetical protein